MKFSPRSFSRAAVLLALFVIPLVPGVAGGAGVPKGKQAPSLVSSPVVLGVAQEGLSLSADSGIWSGSGVRLVLQWLRCDVVGGGCVEVVGESSSSSFVLAGVDVGSTLRVRVRASNKSGEVSAVSEPSGLVAPAPLAAPAPVVKPAAVVAPSSTAPPVVTGKPEQGQTLQASSGAWTGSEPLSYRYQWQRCDSTGLRCAGVEGATAASYALTAADVGATMRALVTAWNTAGSATARSEATAVVAALATMSASSVCSASTLAACPASYFMGPLGKNNILPAKPGAFLILFPLTPYETEQQRRERVLRREQDAGRMFDSVHLHLWGGGSYAGQASCFSPAAVQGNWLDWYAGRSRFASVTWSPDRSLSNINSGAADACIDAVADYLKSKPYRIMLRLFHEHNLPWPVFSGTGQPFVAAWRRVVDRFRARGATNVGFWWAPYELALRAETNDSYPGDAYVDWAGSDIYQVCRVNQSGCYSTHCIEGWATFQQVALYRPLASCASMIDPVGALHWRFGPRKPYVIGEMNTIYDPNQPARKGDWYRQLPAQAKTGTYLRGIAIYDSDTSQYDHNWTVDHPTSNPDVYNGFKQMATDPWLNTG
jgi:hypothetical protein